MSDTAFAFGSQPAPASLGLKKLASDCWPGGRLTSRKLDMRSPMSLTWMGSSARNRRSATASISSLEQMWCGRVTALVFNCGNM